MEETVKSKVRLSVNPNKITKGQMINIFAETYDKITGIPLVFDRIYMQIIDKDGKEVWPLSTIEINSSKVNKLISTSELNAGRYTVRISPSKKLSPMASYSFEVESKMSPAIPLIPLALLAVPSGVRKENIEKEIVEPKEEPKIEWIIYRTERDSKVCHICLPHEGKIFRVDDPDLIRIGAPERGGDTHYGCRCNYDAITDEEVRRIFYNASVEFERLHQLQEYQEIYEVHEVAQVGFKALRRREK